MPELLDEERLCSKRTHDVLEEGSMPTNLTRERGSCTFCSCSSPMGEAEVETVTNGALGTTYPEWGKPYRETVVTARKADKWRARIRPTDLSSTNHERPDN